MPNQPDPNQQSLLQRILAMRFLQPNPIDPSYGGGLNSTVEPAGQPAGGTTWDFMQPQAPVSPGMTAPPERIAQGGPPQGPSAPPQGGMPPPPQGPKMFAGDAPPPASGGMSPDSMVQGSGLPPSGPTHVPPLKFTHPETGSPMMGTGMEGLQGGMVNNMADAQPGPADPLASTPMGPTGMMGDYSPDKMGGGTYLTSDANTDPLLSGLPDFSMRYGQNYDTGQNPNDLVSLIKKLIHKG